jgi:DNA-binding NarL/FixJ family response regulator
VTHVVIADPFPLFRAGVRTCLQRQPDFTVDEAPTLAKLVQAADRADVLLVDADLPPDGGIAAVEILAGRCRAAIVVWTLDPDRETFVAAIRAGAAGCLGKEVSTEGLVRSLRALARGEAIVPRPFQAALLEALRGVQRREQVRGVVARLTERERQVLVQLSKGERNRAIAAELGLSEFTVKRHVQKLLHKLEVRSRGAAAAFHQAAVEDGVLSAGDAR